MKRQLPLKKAQAYIQKYQEKNPLNHTEKVVKLIGEKERKYIPLEHTKIQQINETYNTIQKYINKKFNTNITTQEYIKGIATIKKQERKIGKILKEHNNNLYKKFVNDEMREDKKQKQELMAVLSNKPYDIMTMSTGRNWTSCKKLPISGDLEHPRNYPAKRIKKDINNILIAYLTTKDDTDIKNPKARVNIEPYVTEQDINNPNPEHIYWRLDSLIYGIENEELTKKFTQKIQNEINKINKTVPLDNYIQHKEIGYAGTTVKLKELTEKLKKNNNPIINKIRRNIKTEDPKIIEQIAYAIEIEIPIEKYITKDATHRSIRKKINLHQGIEDQTKNIEKKIDIINNETISYIKRELAINTIDTLTQKEITTTN